MRCFVPVIICIPHQRENTGHAANAEVLYPDILHASKGHGSRVNVGVSFVPMIFYTHPKGQIKGCQVLADTIQSYRPAPFRIPWQLGIAPRTTTRPVIKEKTNLVDSLAVICQVCNHASKHTSTGFKHGVPSIRRCPPVL